MKRIENALWKTNECPKKYERIILGYMRVKSIIAYTFKYIFV